MLNANTRILGIETSCDETSAAVVENGTRVRSNIVASQIPVHERFGGVVPEIASRQHILAISRVTQQALDQAGTNFGDLDSIAVTYGPGLSGPLLVGVTFAKGVALASNLPLLAVNHVEAHILSVWLGENGDPHEPPELPMVALVVSGGHTELVLVTAPGIYRVLGKTLDDAAGEAFDKVGRLLELPYPGGPNIEVAAAAGSIDFQGIPNLTRAWLPGTYDFSFSGLKTAMVREVSRLSSSNGPLDASAVSRLAAAFQESVADVLTYKLAGAATQFGARSAAIVGGVANNGFIRRLAAERVSVPLHLPGPGLSSDNAAMIASAAFWNPKQASLDLDVAPSLKL